MPPLARRLRELQLEAENPSDDALLESFLDFVDERGLRLYSAQEEAVLELVADKNVILGTPTGSGKSLVAAAAHFFAMARGLRSFYTCPIKALVSEKFFALCKDFGADNVGMMTGDAAVNRDAPIICCTAEILANMALREGADAPVDVVVMDEFHYYSDKARGVAWQVPLLVLKNATFLLMSATLGPTATFEAALTKLTARPTVTVTSNDRPVPLDYAYRDTPLHETVAALVKEGKYPIYIVNFTQRACAEEAQNLMSVDYSTKDEKKAIAEALKDARFDTPYGKEVQRFVRHGVGLHHAGLLPKYRLLVEKLAQKGHLKVICGTDTLGVGVNIPIRTVLLTKLCKFDGEKTGILSVRDFQQIGGRAGRKGFDDQGSVVVQAPEHVIENLRLEAKAGADPVKKRRIVKKKPPDRGYVHWDKGTFDRLVTAPPEPLASRFQVTHGMLLNVLSRGARGESGCKAMARIIRDSHDRRAEKRIHAKNALVLFRSMVDAGILEVDGHKVLVNAELPEDFSLNQTLSLYLLDTLPLMDPEGTRFNADPTYALDLLTQVESILENPEIILTKQLDRLKTEKMAEMKAAGVEYDERIAELDKLEYPKPNRDFVYDTFNAFSRKHPWVGQENIRPKSIARDMVEKYMSFHEYVKEYDLERSEGLLLRYLSDVYKTLVQTVPDRFKDESVDEVVTTFRAIVRQVDSSLLDEWERMRDPARALGPKARVDPLAPDERDDVTRDVKAFTVLVRNEIFRLVRALSRRDYEGAAQVLESTTDEDRWTGRRIEDALRDHVAAHGPVRADPAARSPAHMTVAHGEARWDVQQVLLDADDANDLYLAFQIDLERSAAAGRPFVSLVRIGA